MNQGVEGARCAWSRTVWLGCVSRRPFLRLVHDSHGSVYLWIYL